MGSIVRVDDSYCWELEGTQRPLGGARHEAFHAFYELDSELRGDLEEVAENAWRRRTADKPSRRKMLEEVQAYAKRLKRLYSVSVADEAETERRHLSEERAVVDTLLAELG